MIELIADVSAVFQSLRARTASRWSRNEPYDAVDDAVHKRDPGVQAQ